MMNERSTFLAASAAAASLILLTACGNGEAAEEETPEPTEATNGADEQPGDEPTEEIDAHEEYEQDLAEGLYRLNSDLEEAAGPYEGEVRIELPEDVVDHEDSNRSQDYAERRVLEAVTLRPGEHGEAQCALEIEYHYDDANLARIQDGEEWASAFVGEGETEGVASVAEREFTEQERYLLALGPMGANVNERLALHNEQPELADGVELSEDGQTGVAPVGCAADAEDTAESVEIRFPYLLTRSEDPDPLEREDPQYTYWTDEEFQWADQLLEQDAGTVEGSTHFGSVDVTLTEAGEFHVVGQGIRDFEQTDGGWAPEDD